MIARLKPGRTVEQAQQQLDALNARNMVRFPQFKEILTNARFKTQRVRHAARTSCARCAGRSICCGAASRSCC